MPDYFAERRVARQAAQKAAQLIQQFQDKKNFEVGFKGLNDLVTDADIAVEEEIKRLISDAYPTDRILAEESSEVKKSHRGVFG